MNDPFSWPNNSDSISSSGIAAQLTCTKRCPARGLLHLSAPPAPCRLRSPQQRGGVGRRRPLDGLQHVRSDALCPTISHLDSIASFSSRFSERSSDCFSAFCSVTMTRSLLSGLSRSRPHRNGSLRQRWPWSHARNHDDGKRLVEGVELAQHLETVHARHLDVEQHEIRPLPLNRRDAFLSCCRADELVVLVLEDHPQRVADRALVVNHQNAWLHDQSILRVCSARPDPG